MANTFTLDDLITAAEEKYGDTVIEDCVLLNPLRLSKEKRQKLMSLQDTSNELKEENASEEDQLDTLTEMIRLVAQSEKQADDLLEAIGDRLDVLAIVIEKYGKGTQAGEA